MTECPENTDLQMFVDGRLPVGPSAEIADHLDECSNCQDAVEALSGAEPFLSEVARQLGRPTPDVDAKLARVMADAQEGLSTLGASSRSPSGVSELPAGFLTTSDDPELLGSLGTYKVRRMIGRGGMGVVLEAEDTSLKRVVAIKVLAAHVAEEPEAPRRFVREARAAAAVTHENIVTVHAVDQSGKIPYLVMEYVDGVSLEERIRSQGRLEPREVVRTGLQVAAGLAAAHSRKLIHRDIKPGNILLEKKTGRAKISDFGLARVVDKSDVARPELLAGTPEYMAPEQARGEAVDHRSDLFSLGSVLYAMCAGKTPFSAASTRAVISSVADAAVDDVSLLSSETPDWLVGVIQRLHAEDPDDRYQSASEVGRVLREEFLRMKGLTRSSQSAVPGLEPGKGAGHPSGPGSGALPGRGAFGRWINHSRRAAVAVAAVSVLAAVVLVVGFRQQPVVAPGSPQSVDGIGQAAVTSVQPFAVLGVDGGAERHFTKLADAIAAAADGAIVEVCGDGPYQSGPVDLGEKAITIRAAAGRRPQITLADNSSGASDASLIETSGRLRLEGIEFRRGSARKSGQAAARAPDAILVVRSAPLAVINCRFTTAGSAVGILAQHVSRCQIRNSEFVCLRGAAVDWACPDGGRLEMANCVQVGQLGLFVHFHRRDLQDVSVRIDQNTFVAVSGVRLVVPSGRGLRPVEFGSSGNVFGVTKAILEIERLRDMRRVAAGGRQSADLEPSSLLHWSGKQNLFQTGGEMLAVWYQGRRVPAPWAPRGLGDWERFWRGNEKDSLESSPSNAARSLYDRAVGDPSAITPESFRLPTDSPGRKAGPSGRDLGARIEWVGPGAGYEAWKQSVPAGQ